MMPAVGGMTRPVLGNQGILCSAPTALGQLELGLLKHVMEIPQSLKSSSDFGSVLVSLFVWVQ